MATPGLSAPAILSVLKHIADPEMGMDIVELGLIYDVEIAADNRVRVVMTTTTRFCPASGLIAEAVKSKIEEMAGSGMADVALVYEPRWTPDRIGKTAPEPANA